MNCKPGEMAVVVRTMVNGQALVPQELLGVTLTVVHILPRHAGDLGFALWKIKAPISCVVERSYLFSNRRFAPANCTVTLSVIPDACLQPIRGAGAPQQTAIPDELVAY